MVPEHGPSCAEKQTPAAAGRGEIKTSGIGIGGDRPIVLDSMLEAARAKGFYGSLELAAGVLRVSGRFRLEKGPMDKWHACPAIDRSCPGGHES